MEAAASLENKGKGEVIRWDSKTAHLGVKDERSVVMGIIDETADDNVPEEDVGEEGKGSGGIEEGKGVRDRAKRGVMRDEVGEEAKVLVKVGS